MSSYKELLAQREILEKQIEESKALEYAEILNDIKQKMTDYGIKLSDLTNVNNKQIKTNRSRSIVIQKYRDPKSGITWSGRGKPPKWIIGKDKDKFLI